MALTYPQRGFAGAAVAGTIASPGLTSTDGAGTTFTSSTTLTGWTEIANGSWSGDNICVTFGYGTSSEEKILCTFNSGTNTFTVVTRGYDGTTAVAHTTGSLFINTFTATEAAELNAVTQSMKGLLLTDGSAPLPANISTSAAARGTSTKPASADHTHLLGTSTLNSWLSGSASGAMNSAVSVYLSSLAAGALPTTVTTSRVFTATGNPTASVAVSGYNNYIAIADASITAGTSVGNLTLTVGSKAVVQNSPATASGTIISSVTNVSVVASGTISATASRTGNGTLGTVSLIVIGLN